MFENWNEDGFFYFYNAAMVKLTRTGLCYFTLG